MAKLLKRLGSLALAIIMVASLLPVSALQVFAAEDATTVAETWTEVATFEQFQAAIAAGGYIKLTDSFAANEAIVINAAETTIDFNGKTLTLCDSVDYAFQVDKKTTLMDSSGTNAGGMTLTSKYTGGEAHMMRDAGSELIIESGSYVFNASSTGQNATLIHTWGVTTINGGVFSITKENNAGTLYGIFRDTKGSARLTINGGTLTVTAKKAGSAYGVYATTTGSGSGVTGQTKSYLTVTGGEINVELEASGSTSRSVMGIYVLRGTAEFSGGAISVTASGEKLTSYGLSMTNNAKVTVKKLDINLDTSATTSGQGYGYGIANYGTSSEMHLTAETGEVNVTVNSAGGGNAYGLYLSGKGKARITSADVKITANCARTIGSDSYAFGIRNDKCTDFVIDDVTVVANNTATTTNKYCEVLYLNTHADLADTPTSTTINGGSFEGKGNGVYGMYVITNAKVSTIVNINGGVFKARGGDKLINVGSKKIDGVTYKPTVNISGGIFMPTNSTALDSAFKTRYTDAVVATVTNGYNIGVCSDTADIAAAVNKFGSNGKSVVEMTGDVSGSAKSVYNYGFTLNMNGHTMTTTDGNVMDVKGALVVNGNGGTLKTNDTANQGVAAVVARDSMTLNNVRVEAQRGAAVAYQCVDGTGKTVMIDGCTLITKQHLAYSNNLKETSVQRDVHVTIKDSTLVNWDKEVIGAQGNANSNVNNTFTLAGDVHMYVGDGAISYYGQEKIGPTAESAAVTKVEGTHTFEGQTGLTLYTTNVETAGHSVSVTGTTGPDCTTEEITSYLCSCGEASSVKTADATGHVNTTWATTDTTHKKTCDACGQVTVEEAAHTWGDDYVCTDCGYACKHSYTTEESKAPTCSTEGVATHTCTWCGHVYTSEIAKNMDNHESDITNWVITDTTHQQQYACCEQMIGEAAAHQTAEGSVKCLVCGHGCYDKYEITSEKAATCTEVGEVTKTCTECGKSETEVLAKDTQTYVEATASTCIAQGNSAYYACSCGKFYEDAGCTKELAQDAWKLPLAEHTFENYTYNNDATCYVDGTETATCEQEGCTATDTRSKAGTMLPTVAMIGENRFATLDSAATAANEGDTIVLQTNITEETVSAKNNYLAIGGAKEFTLDLNGKTIDMGSYKFVNAGKLTITDSSENKAGTITGTVSPMIENKQGGDDKYGPGELTIAGGTIRPSGDNIAIKVNKGTVTVTGGVITGKGGLIKTVDSAVTDESKCLIYVQAGTFTMSGGEAYIDTTALGLYSVLRVKYGATAEINKGSNIWIKETTPANSDKDYDYAAIAAFGTVTVNGGTVKATRNGSSGTKDVTTTQVRAIYVGSGTTTIKGGTITADRPSSQGNSHTYAIRTGGNATLKVQGGTLNGNAPMNLAGTVQISGGTIEGRSYINNAAITISGGVFNAKGNGEFFGYSKIKSATISGGIFKNTKKTPIFAGDAYAYNKDAVIAEITNGYNFAYASTPAAIVTAVSAIGANGNAVIDLQKDVTASALTKIPYTVTLNMNGFTWTTSAGNAVQISGAVGTANTVTRIIGPGKIITSGAHAVAVSNGAMYLENLYLQSATSATIAYYETSTAYNDLNVIKNCQAVSTRWHGFSLNKDGGSQDGIKFRVEDSVFVTTHTEGNGFGAQSGNTGILDLNDNVHIYYTAKKTAVQADRYTVENAPTQVATNVSVTLNGVTYEGLTLSATGHANAAKTEGTDATCTTDGVATYWTCPTCSLNFSDEACTKVLANTTIAAAHKWTAKEAVSATCTSKGNVAYFDCDNCELFAVETDGQMVVTAWADIETDMIAHTYGAPQWSWAESLATATATFTCGCGHTEEVNGVITSEITTQPTCEGKGEKTFTATVEFGNKEYTDEKTETLSATGHTYGEPTFVWAEDNTAKAVFTCACEHKHEVAAVVTFETTAATCVATGKTVYTAKVTLDKNEYSGTKEVTLEKDMTNHTGTEKWTKTADKHSKAWNCCGTVTVTEAAHTWENGKCSVCEYGCEHANTKVIKGYAATCTDKGLSDGEQCTACGEITKAQEELPVLAHTYGKPTFTWAETKASATATFKCACGDTKVVNGVITSRINTPATCEGKGERTFTATVTFNGVTYTDDVKEEISALDHDFENGTVTEEFAGNCQTESFVTTKCARCDVTNTVKGEKNPAVHTKLVKDDAKAPTCTETGLTEGEHCEACGTVTKKQETVDALNHDFENYTDNGDGTHTGVCANDASHKDTAAHNFVNGTCDKCGAAEKINVAEVDGTGYATLAEAIAAADGKTVKLLTDLEIVGETITIADGKKVTLDMNGKKITVTDNKTSNYELFYIYGELTVTGNGTIELTSTTNRNWNAMSAIFHNRGGELTIENGTYRNLGGTDMAWVVDNSGNYYGDATTNINGGELTSTYTAIRNRMEQNSHGASGKATVNVTGGTINGTTSAIWAQAASESTTAPATGEINVSGGTVGLINTARSAGAVSMTTITGGTVAGFKGEVGELTVKGGELTGTVTILSADGQPADYEITEEGLYAPASSVAEVDGTGYATLAEAIAAADGKTVTLLKDIELTETITIAAGKTITLDLNGKTLVYESTIQGEAMITNKGNLTINDTVGGGVINYNYIGAADPSYSKGNYTISNGGNLTVNGGKITIANLSQHAKYPIDNNSTTGNAVLTINGGHLYNYNTCAIRQFCNSTAYSNIVTINGGLIEGFSAIWMQNPGKNTVNGKLTITGGEIKTTAKAYVNGTSALKDVASKIYCTTEGGAWTADSAVAITGGIINENVYLAEAAPESITIGDATFNGYVQLPGLNGSGTEADPYQIGSVEELILFRDSVNAGEGKYNGAYVKLVADIDLAGINWEPIGNVSYNSKYAPADATKVFSGTFDGNGKVISNLSVTKILNGGADKDANVGLFGITGEGATIKNLTLTNVTINTDGRNVGALAGVTYMATLDNITVNGNIQIKGGNNVSAVGGMTRYSNVSATNITVVGDDGSSIVGNNIVGGIFAEIAPKSGCTFSDLTVENVAISGVGGVGGIVGLLTTGTVENVSVKDVALTGKTEYQGNAMGRIRLGSVAGLMGGKFATIANATVENVTAKNLDGNAVVLPVIGANYDASSNATEAKIGNTYYATFAAAYAAAKAGETVELLQPIVVAKGQTLTLDKDVTIAYSSSKQGHEAMITNNGTLVVDGTTIVFTYTGAGDPNHGWGSYTIYNTGDLTVNSGTVKFEGTQAFGTHCSLAIFQYSGSATINGGDIINNAYRSLRLWKGDVTINGGNFQGQTWVHCVDDSAKLTITGGTFAPAKNGGDGSSVFVNNSGKKAELAVTGGTFATKIGANDVAALAGAITGGKFTEAAKNGTNAALYEGMVFGNADADGYYTLEEGLKGKGTEADPYQIGSVEELILFRDSVNAGETKYNAPGVYVALTADIDMAGIDWSVNIGDDCNVTFDGIFDGKGYTISNLTAIETAQKADGYVCTGLFGAIAGKAVIKNLTIAKATIDTGDFTGNNASVVVGFAWAATGSIENVKVVDATINANKIDGTGAIVGYAYSSTLKVTDCTVENTTVNGKAYVGGVIGYAGGKVTLNGNTVTGTTVNATSCAAGGVAGIIQSGSAADNTVNDIVLTSAHENWKNAVGVVVGTYTGNSVTVSGTITNSTAAIVGVKHADKPTAPLAKTEAKIGDTYYATLDAALAAAKAGDEIVALTTIVIAKGETKTINLPAGVTVTMVTDDAKEYALILNYGNLTITGEGKLSYQYTGNDQSDAHNTIESAPGSVLTVKGGTIENLSENCLIAYAVDGLTNGGNGDVTINIEGGKISSKKIAVRIFANSTTNTGTLNISGGEISGRVIIQNASAKANKAALNITGGTFNTNGYKTDVLYVGGSNGASGDITASVSGGTFNGEILSAIDAGFVSGGTFDRAFDETFCAEGFVLVENADGTYGVIQGLKGKGTEADPYQIGTLEELILFRDTVNAGKTYYNAPGVYVALTADIDMAGINWVGIGSINMTHGFMGNFDGKGFKIKNLTITDPAVDSDGYAYAGFFSITEGEKDAENVIKNLTIENVTISTNGHIVAAAIAYPYYTTVENVTVCGDINITGGDYTAGALAYTRRCVNASNVTVSGNAGSTITGNITVGGVISDIQMNGGLTANYSNFAVSGVKITGQKQVGGISGIICEQTLNGATVKNVELVCQDARVGIVSGCLGGTSTISNVVTENVTGADVIVGGDFNNGIAAAAKIGDTYYTTFAKAYAAAEAGDTVELLKPIVVAKGETLTLDKDVNIVYTSNVVGEDMITVRGTLNVAAGKITYTNTDKTGNNVTVSTISCEPGSVLNVTGGTIENKTVYSTGSYAYAIDLLTNGNLGDVTATISGGKVYSDYMAIRQFNNGTACKNTLTVTGGEIYGAKRAIQVHMDNNAAYLTISGGKVEAGEDGYALCLFPTTATNIAVTGGQFVGTVYSGTNGIISGGIFNEEVYEGYCAEGYLPTDNGDGTYGVIQGLKGKGTEADPYQIGTLEELILFRDTVNAGKTYYNAPGVYVALTADIDMAGINWVGIGSINMTHGFMGNFDGKGFKIKNLTITDPAVDSDGYAYAGFFSITEGEKDAENVIKNLTIENVTISTNGHIVAAAIAYPYYTTVENVTVCGDINITGGDYTAGALAYTRRCVNASNVTVSGNAGSTITGKSTVGGVISDIQMNGGLIANYSNFAASGLTITGNSCVGGISGIICKQTLNGATVKDVTLVCGKATVGTVAGSWGDVSTITDVVVENVTGATAVIGATYKENNAVEAKIGDTYYATFAAAYAAAKANETITLLTDLTASEIVVIDKAITLDGNGKTLTSTATRAINVNCADKVLIKDLTIATTANTERAINVIQKAADLTLENVTAEGFKYTLFVAGSSVGSDITVNGGKLSGYAAINIAGNNTTVTVNNAELVGVNNVPAHASNAFAVINIGEADGAVVTVNGGSLTATSTTGNRQFAVSGFYATNAKVTVDAELNLANGDVFNGKVEQIAASFRAEYADELLAKGYMTETSATAGLVDVAGFAAASVNGVGYTKLQDAIDAAEALGEATVVVLNNQDLTSHIIISDGITLDLNGKTVKTTRYFTVYGDVVDGTAGGEGIVIAAKTHVMGQKSFMSIYDSAAGGYRFYAFEVVSAGFKDVDATTVKFGIKLEFVNAEAYTLIANSDTKLELHALISWTGLAAPMDYIFSDATVKSYASLVAADLANSGSTKKAITLTFTGVEVLGEDGQINVTPVLESETNISGAAATINWKANS